MSRWCTRQRQWSVASPQVFKPYNSPYTLPIPASAKPAAMTTAPLVNYTQAGSGGVTDLAGATANFALRFSGGRRSRDRVP